MKKLKRAAACAAALMMAIGVSSCGKSGKDDSSSMPEKKLEESQQEIVQRLADSITNPRELTNSTIEWMSFYDINPTASEDKEIGVDLAIFQTKYNGKITYRSTTWETKFQDIAAAVMTNDSPDFIGADDMDIFPIGAIKQMIEPLDDYINFDDPLWADVKEANEQFVYKGKHYVAVSRIDPAYIFVYNKKTIEDNSMEDPAEMYANGEWNWDTFADMCTEFTDAEQDKYALDGWYYDLALNQSSGKPIVGMDGGEIKNYISSAELEKAQTFMYDLQKNGVVYPKHEHDWKIRDDVNGGGMASGLTLFYPIGLWALEDAPSVTKPFGDLSSGEVMFVPVPCAADSDAMYAPSRVHGFAICKGSKNPEGVAAWMDCTRYAETDEPAHNVTIEQYQKDYGWTDEMLEMREEVYRLAAEHPVFEFSQGVSTDLKSVAENAVKATMHPSDPQTWSQVVQANQPVIDFAIEEAQKNIDS